MHGFQFLDIWIHHSAWSSSNCERFKIFNTSAAGSEYCAFVILHFKWTSWMFQMLFSFNGLFAMCFVLLVLKGFSLPAGSLLEWKFILTRNLGFFLDMATLLMALGHYLHIWWLHGMAFHLVDVALFLNIRVNIIFNFCS